jgi:hypothetical protein
MFSALALFHALREYDIDFKTRTQRIIPRTQEMVIEHDATMDVPLDEMEARLAVLRNLVRV